MSWFSSFKDILYFQIAEKTDLSGDRTKYFVWNYDKFQQVYYGTPSVNLFSKGSNKYCV